MYLITNALHRYKMKFHFFQVRHLLIIIILLILFYGFFLFGQNSATFCNLILYYEYFLRKTHASPSYTNKNNERNF